MKHILNNLTEQEKNTIREQHTGGMKVMTENFSKLINSKLGDSKPLVSEGEGVEIDEESDLGEASIFSPEEIERVKNFNETTKGVTMVLKSIDNLFDSINREAYHKSRRAILNVLDELQNDVNNSDESSVDI